MLRQLIEVRVWAALVAVMLVVLAGCKEEPADKDTAADTEAKPKAAAEPQPEKAAEPKPEGAAEATPAAGADKQDVLARLAKADALDGEVDKVVKRCGNCRLGMDGKPEHSLTVQDYTLHFCTEHCQKRTAEDAEGHILAWQIPEE